MQIEAYDIPLLLGKERIASRFQLSSYDLAGGDSGASGERTGTPEGAAFARPSLQGSGDPSGHPLRLRRWRVGQPAWDPPGWAYLPIKHFSLGRHPWANSHYHCTADNRSVAGLGNVIGPLLSPLGGVGQNQQTTRLMREAIIQKGDLVG
jgi:hypothetical protein